MIWDPIFGWDWDRIRMIFLVSLFAFLFSGFISTTEGGGFFDPSQQLLTWVGEHEVAFLMVSYASMTPGKSLGSPLEVPLPDDYFR